MDTHMTTVYKPTNLPKELTNEEFIELAEGLIQWDIIQSYNTTTRSFTSSFDVQGQFEAMMHAILSLAAQIYDFRYANQGQPQGQPQPTEQEPRKLAANEPAIILPFTKR